MVNLEPAFGTHTETTVIRKLTLVNYSQELKRISITHALSPIHSVRDSFERPSHGGGGVHT